MKELSFDKMEVLEGGCDVADGFGIAMGIAGVAFVIAFPPSAFWIVPAGTVAGAGLGAAIGGCINGLME